MTNGIGIGFVASDEIDAKTSSSETITETGEAEEFFPVVAAIEITEASGVVVPGTISIGYNSPNYDNIVPLATLGLGIALTNILVSSVKVPSDTEVKVKKVTQTVGTTHKFRVRIFGNLNS